uniref:Uncharacterized protein n=1 Tax=Anopheles dirus TaxID=7168 RepID=A0A182NIX2_9DIPT
MDIGNEDDLNDVIECSQTPQVPALRSKIRERKMNYREQTPKTDRKKSKRKDKRAQDSKTVSQCLQQEWKKPRGRGRQLKSTVTATKPSPATELEEHIKFATQQSTLLQQGVAGGVEACPSVSLFARQEHVVANYITNEAAEARVEAELQNLLAGFRAEYEEQCGTMGGSPSVRPCVPVAPVTPELPDTIPSTRVENVPMELGEGMTAAPEVLRFNLSGCQSFSEHSLMPTFSEEIARLESIAEDRDRNSAMKVPTISTLLTDVPEVTEGFPLNIGRDISVAEPAARSNLSVQLDPVDMDLEPPELQPPVTVEYPKASQRSQSKQHPRTADCAVQAKFPFQKRNIGVQHRPTGSFDFTDRNLILLGQAVEADPTLLYQRMRRIAKTSNESNQRECDLASLFTRDDPYYANLKHFM